MAFLFINGHFTALFNGADIGTTEDGFEIVETPAEEEIKTDDGGDTIIDAINLGFNTKVRLTYMEYSKIAAAIHGIMALGDPLANVGLKRSALSKVLKLTPVAGTAAATLLGSNSYYFDLASVNEEVVTKLATKCRRGPITFGCLPDPSNSSKSYRVAAT